jgi:hypothetical protein
VTITPYEPASSPWHGRHWLARCQRLWPRSSRFVGKHEKIGVEQEFAGTIVGEVDGTPYTGDFQEEPAKK